MYTNCWFTVTYILHSLAICVSSYMSIAPQVIVIETSHFIVMYQSYAHIYMSYYGTVAYIVSLVAILFFYILHQFH